MRPIAPLIAVLCAGAAAYLGSALMSRADTPHDGRFVMITEAKTNNVWELNQDTGEVRVCMPAPDPKLAPDCSPKGAW